MSFFVSQSFAYFLKSLLLYGVCIYVYRHYSNQHKGKTQKGTKEKNIKHKRYDMWRRWLFFQRQVFLLLESFWIFYFVVGIWFTTQILIDKYRQWCKVHFIVLSMLFVCVCDFFDWFWVNHSRIRVSNIWMVFVLSRWVAILIFIFAVCFFLFITIILKFILNCGFDHSMSKLKLKFCGHKPAEEFMIHINWIYLVLRYFDVCVCKLPGYKLNN